MLLFLYNNWLGHMGTLKSSTIGSAVCMYAPVTKMWLFTALLLNDCHNFISPLLGYEVFILQKMLSRLESFLSCAMAVPFLLADPLITA